MTTISPPSAAPQTIYPVDPQHLRRMLETGEAYLVDVREPSEHACERIEGAVLMPLTGFNPANLQVPAGKKLVLHCKAGGRSTSACQQVVKAGLGSVWNLTGGIEGWKAAGLPTIANPAAPRPGMDPMRQTQFTIGLFTLAGVLLGALVNPWFLLLSGFMGCGLIMAGVTGLCPLLTVMTSMPWNRKAADKSSSSCCCCGPGETCK